MCRFCEFPNNSDKNKIKRRSFLTGMLASSYALSNASAVASERKKIYSDSQPAKTNGLPKPQNALTPDEALDRLLSGNARYQKGVTKRHDFLAEREPLLNGQNPYAAVLSCADSRIAPEYAFDSSRGDLFVVRVAGNFVNPDNIASFEFAIDVLNPPLLVVLGHEACGAVNAAIASIQGAPELPGHLPSLVAALSPAVTAVKEKSGDLLENATRENVKRTVETLKNATPLLSAAVSDNRLKIVGGIYRLTDGKVNIIA